MKFKIDPTKLFTYILALLSGLAIGFNFSSQVLLHLVATLGFGLVLYWFYSLFSGRQKSIWTTVITSLIIFLVLDYGTEWAHVIYPLLATFIAISIKFFWEWRGSPIVNPAVAALLFMAGIAALIPGLDTPFMSWWGASFQGWVSLVVVLAWMVLGLNKWKKWPAVLAFLVSHGVILLLRGTSAETIQFIFTDATVYFFATVMLIDPKTSPILPKQQVVFGLLAALALNSLFQGGAPYAELFAIVTANLGFMIMRPARKKMV